MSGWGGGGGGGGVKECWIVHAALMHKNGCLSGAYYRKLGESKGAKLKIHNYLPTHVHTEGCGLPVHTYRKRSHFQLEPN